METLLIDIDGTILNSFKSVCDKCGNVTYPDSATSVAKEINLVNKLRKTGKYRIVLWTGRGWDKLNITLAQLNKIKIKYDALLMGKPVGTYIDADSFKSVKEFMHE